MINVALKGKKAQVQRLADGKVTGISQWVPVDKLNMKKVKELGQDSNNGASKVTLAKMLHLFDIAGQKPARLGPISKAIKGFRK